MNPTNKVISNCITYIEKNIKAKITLGVIANEIGISKYHLHRIFRGLTNVSLADYIRSRKLSLSVNDLMRKDYRIIDIAMEYGFEYEQNYIRSFKSEFGMTPLKARKSNSDIEISEPINVNEIFEVNNAVIYKPHFVVRQEFKIAGIKHKILNSNDNTLAVSYGKQFFYGEKQNIVNIMNPDHYYGYTHWDEKEENCNYYIPAVLVGDASAIPAYMTSITVPTNKYAVFKLIGFFDPIEIEGRHLIPIIDYMYKRWISSKGYQMAGNFRFEFIDTRISRNNYCELSLYMPIK